jgi:hypothetical protein
MRREVVISGAGLCCHLGDDLDQICARVRSGTATTFERWNPPLAYQSRNRLVGLYHGRLAELDKRCTRLMGAGRAPSVVPLS